MALIEVVERIPLCDMGEDMAGEIFCHCADAENTACKFFKHEEAGTWEWNGEQIPVIPFGNCAHAQFEYRYRGWGNCRNYEMEESRDPRNRHLDSMLVTVGGKVYDCVKVKLDGRIIFNEHDEEK